MFTFREFLLAEAQEDNNSKNFKKRTAAERKRETRLNAEAADAAERAVDDRLQRDEEAE